MEVLCFVAAWFLGGFVNGISGMGAAMVAVPLVISFIPGQTLIPATCFLALVITGQMAWVYRASCRWGSIKTMLMGSAIGAVLGVYVLLFLSAPLLKLMTGLVMVLFVAWFMIRPKSTTVGQENGVKAAIAGFFSGALNSSISFGGPPVAVYTFNVPWNKEETVGSLNMYSFISFIITCSVHFMADLYTAEVLRWIAYGVPASMVGAMASMPVARRLSVEMFKRILLIVIGISGFVSVVRSLIELQ